MVDNTYDELLHIVPYKGQDVWWELSHMEYHPMRDRFNKSIEIQLTEVDSAVIG